MNWLKTKQAFWISTVVFSFTQTSLLISLKDFGPLSDFLAHQLTFSPQEFLRQLEEWGPERVRVFLSHYYFDFIHPVAYALFLATSFYQLNPKRTQLAVTGAFLIAAFDEIENLIQLPIHIGVISPHSILFYIAAASAWLKWALAVILLSYLGVVTIKELMKKI